MTVTVPMDVYESPQEMVVLLPLGGAKKDSVILKCEGNSLHIVGTREHPPIKSSLTPLQEQCFWGDFKKEVHLPDNAAFDRIHSELSPENILTIIIPKVFVPEKIVVDIQ